MTISCEFKGHADKIVPQTIELDLTAVFFVLRFNVALMVIWVFALPVKGNKRHSPELAVTASRTDLAGVNSTMIETDGGQQKPRMDHLRDR